MPALTMTGNGLNFSFLAAQSDDSTFLLKLPEVVEEVLTTEGVDGRRWRTTFEQMRPVQLETISDCLTFVAAVALAQEHRQLSGTLVGMTWAAGGATYVYKDVHVSKVISRPIAGAVVGGGASSSAACHVRTTWILEPTDFRVFSN